MKNLLFALCKEPVGKYTVTTTLYGPVVQLVRTLACHARGRRFEPDPGRHRRGVIPAKFIKQIERGNPLPLGGG